MLLLTLKQLHELYKKEYREKTILPFIPLKAGFNLVTVARDWFGESIYVCPYIKMDKIEICSQCKDRFVCFTNKWE